MKRCLFITGILTLILMNCTEDDLPLNPYDGVDYGDTTLVIDTLSPTSFVRLHKEVLSPSCNVLGANQFAFQTYKNYFSHFKVNYL